MTVQTAVFLFLSSCSLIFAITCYECTSNGGDCISTAKSCGYGLFGCVKIVTYNGGIDRMGNWEQDQERRIVSIWRGCALIPFGHVDMCNQLPIFGARIQRCTCFNDFCNTASNPRFLLPFLFILFT